MPIFTYICKKCGERFEHMEGVLYSDEELKCPACGSGSADKALSTFCVGKASASSHGCDNIPGPACGGCSGGSCGLG